MIVVLYIGSVALLAAPLPAGVVAWSKFRKLAVGRDALIPLVVLSASYVFLVLGLVIKDLIGPDYSERRSTTIDVNTVLALLALCWGLLRRSPARLALGVFGVLVTLGWLYMALVSVAV